MLKITGAQRANFKKVLGKFSNGQNCHKLSIMVEMAKLVKNGQK